MGENRGNVSLTLKLWSSPGAFVQVHDGARGKGGVSVCVHLHMGRGGGQGVIKPFKDNFVPPG